jgi:hypothetical protein
MSRDVVDDLLRHRGPDHGVADRGRAGSGFADLGSWRPSGALERSYERGDYEQRHEVRVLPGNSEHQRHDAVACLVHQPERDYRVADKQPGAAEALGAARGRRLPVSHHALGSVSVPAIGLIARVHTALRPRRRSWSPHSRRRRCRYRVRQLSEEAGSPVTSEGGDAAGVAAGIYLPAVRRYGQPGVAVDDAGSRGLREFRHIGVHADAAAWSGERVWPAGAGESARPEQQARATAGQLGGHLRVPGAARGLVAFAHGSGSSRLAPACSARRAEGRAGGVITDAGGTVTQTTAVMKP